METIEGLKGLASSQRVLCSLGANHRNKPTQWPFWGGMHEAPETWSPLYTPNLLVPLA